MDKELETVRLLDQTDCSLQTRTNQAIFSPATRTGVQFVVVSIDFPKEVIRCLLKMNLKLVGVIRECEDTPELRKLAQEFFDDNKNALAFCTELKNCLKRVKDKYSGIIDALKLVDESDVNRYVKTRLKLKKIEGAGDPFNELKNIFRSLSTYLDGKLQTSKNRLDKKLKTIQARRRVFSITFDVTLGVVVIGSVVAAAVAAPPVAAAGLAAVGSISLRSWVNSLWKKDEVAVKEQKDVVELMENATHNVIQQLDDIERDIKVLENAIEPLLSIPNEVTVKIRIEKIKEKMEVFVKNVNDWEVQADMCIRNGQLAETVVRKKLKKPPHRSIPKRRSKSGCLF